MGRPRGQLSHLDTATAGGTDLRFAGGRQRRVLVELEDHPQVAVPVDPVQDLRREIRGELDAPAGARHEGALPGGSHPLRVGRPDDTDRRQGKDVGVSAPVPVEVVLFQRRQGLPQLDLGPDPAGAFFLSFLFPL